MDLNILWFILVTILFIGFFFLEGFDYGVGILLPFLGENDTERRMVINTIGPVWDGNEAWMITAGGAAFAAFPNFYATLFSGFYLALFLILAALIIRGVAFGFRSKDDNPVWRSFWDWAIFAGSLLPALLWGVAMANLLQGVPIDGQMEFAGSFWSLISLYTLIGGVTWLLLFILNGAIFISLKTEGKLAEKASQVAKKAGLLAIPVVILQDVLIYFQTDLFQSLGAVIVLLAALAALTGALICLWISRHGWAMAANGLAIALSTLAIFWGLFPRLMVSSLNPEWSLTIYNASSSPYTLKVMTIVALTMVPIVLVYQGWTYWVFRQRINGKNLYY